ncbi:DUF6197 family protein [Streptomyces heilongjiangensis]|uniref:Uncharacterized protein n=1 Tax=Streptomyces heilongjiangensis TaxID=945052 RepID=A0ABW1BHH5_9ACTN|nr:hypothetical protein [Streptomyces heilongjiangensis]MDC2951089.1 hypothetical protein [Streptomyces heilongjiangensis]
MNAPSVAVQAPERAAPTEHPPLTLDDRLAAEDAFMTERLTMAAAAVDVNTAFRVPDVEAVDLADVVRVPSGVQPYRPPVDLYPTPVAAVLQRARARLERDGWTTGALVDEDGARCLYGAIRAEANGSAATESDALTVLLEAIRRRFPDEDDAVTVPSFNDSCSGPRTPLRLLGEAADLAHARAL